MESSAQEIHENLNAVIDYQTHHRLRETQGRHRAEELNERIMIWSVFVTVAIFSVGFGQVNIFYLFSIVIQFYILQVYVLKSFFAEKRPSQMYGRHWNFIFESQKVAKKWLKKLWFWTVQLYGLNCYYSNIFQTVSAVYLFVIDWMMVKLSEWDSLAANVFRNVKLISIVIFSSLWFELLVYKYLSGFNESLNGMGPFCTLNQFRPY